MRRALAAAGRRAARVRPTGVLGHEDQLVPGVKGPVAPVRARPLFDQDRRPCRRAHRLHRDRLPAVASVREHPIARERSAQQAGPAPAPPRLTASTRVASGGCPGPPFAGDESAVNTAAAIRATDFVFMSSSPLSASSVLPVHQVRQRHHPVMGHAPEHPLALAQRQDIAHPPRRSGRAVASAGLRETPPRSKRRGADT